MNEAFIFINDNKLVVIYGEDERTAVMELETDVERELVSGLIGDVNFWGNFLSSLSSAVTTHLGVSSE